MSVLERGALVDSRFEVLDLIGHGGMGMVYRARQKDIERDVALKILKPTLLLQPEKAKRFQREAQLVSKLNHPNIVRIFAVGVETEQPYIAMEYLSGRQLSDLIANEGPLPWQKAIPLFIQLCDALIYAHELHIIHRDIKPGNIVVMTDTAGDATVKLVDFGIAKSLVESGPSLTETEMVLGSVFYLSPGQFEGRDADPAADIYSLGCTFFEVLSGAPPFVGSTVFGTIHKSTTEELPKIENIPAALQTLLEAMTAKSADARVNSAAAVKRNLELIAGGGDVESELRRMSVKSPQRKPVKPARFLMPLAIVAAFVVSAYALSKLCQQPVTGLQSASYLTDTDAERKLVDQIGKAIDTGRTSLLAMQYERLASMYYEGFALEAKYVALEGVYLEQENLRSTDGVDLLQHIAGADLTLGDSMEANKLFKKIDSWRPSLEIGSAGLELETLLALGKYDESVALAHKVRQLMFEEEKYPGARLMIWHDAGLANLRVGNYKEALDDFNEAILRNGITMRTHNDLARSDLEVMLAWTGLKKAIPDAEYKRVVDAVTTPESRNAASCVNKLIAWTLSAELMIRRGDREDGYRRAGETMELVDATPDGYAASVEFAMTLRNLEAIASLLDGTKAAAVRSDIKRLEARIDSLHHKLNDSQDIATKVPVPIPHAAEGKAIIEKLCE